MTFNPFITALISLSLTSIGLIFLERPRLESPRLETGRLQTPHLEKPHLGRPHLGRPHLETPSAKQASALPRQVHGKNLFSQVLPLLLAFGATYAVFRLLTGSNQIALAIALLGSALPSLVAKRRLIQRKKELAASWPEAMDAIISGLHSGKNITECALELGTRGPELLRPIFNRIGVHIQEGALLEDALGAELQNLESAPGDQLFATLRFAKEFGGGATLTALRFLAAFVREDRQVIEEIDTKFGWVRNSASLGAAAPWLLLLILSVQPSTVSAFATPIGKAILSFGVIATASAYLWMERISRLPDQPRPFAQAQSLMDQK